MPYNTKTEDGFVALNSDNVQNTSTVPGDTVSDALDDLATNVGALDSDDVANVSGVPGVTVTDALNDLLASSGGGAVTAVDIDFTALPSQDFNPGGGNADVTIDGATWRTTGTAFATAMEIVNGTGLVITRVVGGAAAQGAYIGFRPYLTPALPTDPVIEQYPGLDLSKRLRIVLAYDSTPGVGQYAVGYNNGGAEDDYLNSGFRTGAIRNLTTQSGFANGIFAATNTTLPVGTNVIAFETTGIQRIQPYAGELTPVGAVPPAESFAGLRAGIDFANTNAASSPQPIADAQNAAAAERATAQAGVIFFGTFPASGSGTMTLKRLRIEVG